MADLTGKITLVTGASSGIGKETAIELAKMGATVVCLSRDPERAAAEIRERSGSARIETLAADLATIAGGKRAAEEFLARHKQLHILVNNAGAAYGKRELNSDGVEKTLALNHFGYFVLTTALLDTLIASAPARIVSVASRGHKRAKLDVNDFTMSTGWSQMLAYGNSKLCNMLFTRELTRRLAGKGVTATCLHPGVVSTNIWGASGSLGGRLFGILGKPFMVTPAQGADTIVWLASSPECAGQSGGYYIRRQLAPTSDAAKDDALATRLWAASEAVVNR